MSTFSKENTNEIFEDIKRNLSRGVKDRKHDFHTPVFSNINKQNSIESRVVVLRDFDSKIYFNGRKNLIRRSFANIP